MLFKFLALAIVTQAEVYRRANEVRHCGSRDYVQELDRFTENDVAQGILLHNILSQEIATGTLNKKSKYKPQILVNFFSFQKNRKKGKVTNKQVFTCD